MAPINPKHPKYRSRSSKSVPVTATRLPKTKNEVSCNWKNLLKQMGPRTKLNSTSKLTPRTGPSAAANLGTSAPTCTPPESKPKPREIWFDDVDECLLDPEDQPTLCPPEERKNALVKQHSFQGPTKIISMDCEMVGVGLGGKDSILARVSVVNHFGHCIYDKYVKPREKVTDFRTPVSGIRPKDLEEAEEFLVVQKEVNDLLTNRILVGHSIHNDLKVLFLTHPRKMIRDTSRFKYFRNCFGGRTPSLKKLSERFLGVQVQQGEHSSVQDAQAAMRLYTMFRKDWESQRKLRSKQRPITKEKEPAPPRLTTSSTNPSTHPQYCDSDSDE